MTGIVEFLRARYDEDEAIIRATDHEWLGPWELEHTHKHGAGDAAFYARNTPRRVLADVEAKRRIVVELHTETDGYCDECGLGTMDSGPGDRGDFTPVRWPCPTLQLLALPYTDHPDYREEWRP